MTANTGLMFPGQGSQAVGMLADVAADHPLVVDTFTEASEALGLDLWKLASEGPAEALDRTENTQPALLTASVAVYRVFVDRTGAAPAVAAGHSLGEYSALVAAGAIDLADAVRLVARRGQLMQEAVPAGQGGMAAVLGLDDDAVARCCEEAAAGEILAPANYNAPGQVVIAGTAAAVQRAVDVCKAAGAKRVMPLAVSVPSHCELMRPAAERFTADLQALNIAMPAFPVVQNTDASVAEDAEGIRSRLLAQLYAPVRWTDCVRRMADHGATRLLECGPGKVLTALVRRIDGDLDAVALGSADALAGLDA